MINTSLKKWSKAESCLKMAVYLRDKITNDEELVKNYIWLCNLDTNQEKWNEGYEALNEAVELGKSLSDECYLADALIALGSFYQQQNKDKEANPLL